MRGKPNQENSGLRRRSAMATALALFIHHLLLLLLILLLVPPAYSGQENAPTSEADALLLLKQSFANSTALSSWTPAANPCDPESRWAGVVCLNGKVSGLQLNGMALSGTINADALTRLPGLRTVSFLNNSFSGGIPALSRLRTLRAIYLAHNRLTNDIPSDFFDGMTRLRRLWLNGNSFTGYIPYSLSQCTNLLELHLEDNKFRGPIPALLLPHLSSFNVSNNKLEGVISDIYYMFNESSFLGNKNLCGVQLGSKPCKAGPQTSSGKLVGVFMMAVTFVCLAVYLITKREKREEGRLESFASKGRSVEAGRVSPNPSIKKLGHTTLSIRKEEPDHIYIVRESKNTPALPASDGGGGGGGGVGDLVIVNEKKGVFGLPDLMKAAAEVMGSGGLGSAYKAVMANGVAVVVKRMRNMDRVGKESFDAQMRRLGGFAHPNVLAPLAYHYRKDEKLLIYEYIPKGSLLYVLHGDRGINHASLDWPTRTKIARGVARGLAYLHAELPSAEAPHGNLKSGNVLLAPDLEPLLIDYGFLPLANPAQASTTMQAHRSPEVAAGSPVSVRSDVYCLGILLLELLTGKFPSQYLGSGKGGTDVVQWATYAVSEGREVEILDPAVVAGTSSASVPDMKRLIRVAIECVESDPDRRLQLSEAIERIEEVATEAEKTAPLPQLSIRDGPGEISRRRVRSVDDRSARRIGRIGDRSGRRSESIGGRSGRRSESISEPSARRCVENVSLSMS